MLVYQKKLNIRGSLSAINITDDLQIICGTKTGDIQFLQLDQEKGQIQYLTQIKSQPPTTLPQGLTPGILYSQIDQPYASTVITNISCNRDNIVISSLDDQILVLQNQKITNVLYMQNPYSCQLCQDIFVSTENAKLNIFTSKFQFIQQLIGHVDQIKCIVPYQGMNQILSTSNDNTTRIFDYETNSQLVYKVGAQGLNCAIVNQKLFLTQTDKQILLFRRDNNQPIDQYDIKDLTNVQCIQNYNLIVASSFEQLYFLKIDENDKLECILTKQLDNQSWINDITMKIIDNQLYILVCTGKERKYDRMNKSQNGRSIIYVYKLQLENKQIKKSRFK